MSFESTILFFAMLIEIIVTVILILLFVLLKKKKATIFVSVVGVLLYWGMLFLDDIVPDTKPTSNHYVESSKKSNNISSKYEYEIKNIKDISYPGAVRLKLKAVVKDSDNITQEEFENLCQKIIYEYIETKDVNGISILLYQDERDIITSTLSVGLCDYYPNGKVADANTVSTGDYSKSIFTYEFKEKDLQYKPTDEELEVYYDFKLLYVEKGYNVNYTPNGEAECKEITAKNHNISIDTIDEILNKVSFYKFFQ